MSEDPSVSSESKVLVVRVKWSRLIRYATYVMGYNERNAVTGIETKMIESSQPASR